MHHERMLAYVVELLDVDADCMICSEFPTWAGGGFCCVVAC